MATSYAKHFSTKQTPQSEPIPDKPMVANSAGGFSFAVDDWTRLDRWLVLGSDGGSYYASEKKLTVENARAVQACLKEDGNVPAPCCSILRSERPIAARSAQESA